MNLTSLYVNARITSRGCVGRAEATEALQDVQLERERGKSETMEEAMKELEMQASRLWLISRSRPMKR